MATQEFYIREATENEARGPFNFEQLSSLAEAGQVKPETLYYEATAEEWREIARNSELKEGLFPERKKLLVRPKLIATVNKSPAAARSEAPVTVDDMLAAAEGRTSDTKDKKDPAISAARAARVGMWSAILMLVLSAAGELLPAADALLSADVSKIVAQPLAFLGTLDLLLAVLLGLGMVNLYPFIRFRAAVGLGLFGFIFYVQRQQMPLLAACAGNLGLYFSTILLSPLPVTLAALVGLAGMGGASYYLLSV